MQIQSETDFHQITTPDWQLVARRQTDRWHHALQLPVNGGWVTALASKEGAPDDFAPPSSAFQDMRLERLDAQTCELQLFGQCGKRIYSAAVRCQGNSLTFDQCVRVPQFLAFATSEYVLTPGFLPERITCAAMAELPNTEVKHDEERLFAAVVDTAAQQKAHTLRWGYVLRVLPIEL